MTRSPRLADVMEAAVERALGELRVALPGSVVTYDAAQQRADVQPITRQTYRDEEEEEQSVKLPVIRNVPVLFPGGGGFRLTFPVRAGDHVWLIFCDTSLDKYLANGGADVDPVSLHSHHLTDAVALPGLHPFSDPWSGAGTAEVTLGKDGGPQVVCRAATVELGGDATVPPIDAVIKGTTYRAAEATSNSALGAAMTSLAAAMTALAAAIPSIATIPTNGPAAASAATAAAAAATAAASAVIAFEGAAVNYLSTIVKTK